MLSYREQERLIRCPYCNFTQALAHRYQTHIVKCRKQHPEARIVACDFDATHLIPEPELQHHYEVCEAKKILENELVDNNDDTAVPKIEPPHIVLEAREEWDDEVPHPSYNPDEYCMQNNVIRSIKIESKAVRRQFQKDERTRHRQLGGVVPNKMESDNPIVYYPYKHAHPHLEVEEEPPTKVKEMMKQIRSNKTVVRQNPFKE